MKLRELTALAREWTDDEGDCRDVLIPDKAHHRAANEALREAVYRARLLVDSTTARLTVIDVQPGVACYRIPAEVIVARRIEFVCEQEGARPRVLERVNYDYLDKRRPGWTGYGCAWPDTVVQDLQKREFRLCGRPQLAGTLNLTVWRKLLDSETLKSPDSEPCIPDEYHESLVHWMCYRAFMRKDAETQDKQLAAEHYGQFLEAFGDRPTLQALQALATDHTADINPHYF